MNVQLRIESIVHGGEGLGRTDGRVVFVAGSAPGDLVLAELPEGARELRGRLLSVLEPGPSRVVPPCPIVGQCGGCPLQQLGAAAQREAKAALVVDALARIGGYAAGSYRLEALVPSPLEYRYRRRARLHRGPAGSWGFSARASDRVVPVGECLLFEPGLQSFADAVRAAIAEQGGLPEVTDLGLDLSDRGAGSLDLRTARPAGAALRKRAEALLAKVPKLRGLTLGMAGAAEFLGDPVIADSPAPARFRTRADLFSQANRTATPHLVRAALEALGAEANGRVLELYCGSGTFTLPLLETARHVTGVESSAASLSLLRRSATEAGLDANDKLRLIAGDAVKVALPAADAVLLDPPRTGAAGLIPRLAALAPRRIVYVSCDAPSFARDAKLLAARGYRLERLTPFDLFPQTAHLELVAIFTPV